jgi:hypothetical protein
MAEVVAESMVGGTNFHRKMIKREVPGPWSSTFSGKENGA